MRSTKDRFTDAQDVRREPPGEVLATELIVHGVGGAPPSDLLDDFHPMRVSGDHLAGFYEPHQPPDRGEPGLPADRFPREAFAWGGLTSGDAARALWFLLLPFALMNAGGWMHARLSDGMRVMARSVLRLLASLGTVMAVVMFSQLALDLVAYQCGWLNESCRDGHWWLSFLDASIFATRPSRILVLGAVVPLSGLALWWASSLVSFRNFEEYLVVDPDQPRERPPPGGGDAEIRLDDAWFWRGAAPVRRLRRLHFQLGVAVVGVVLALSVAELTPLGWTVGAFVIVWGGTAVTAVLLYAIGHPGVAVSAEGGRFDSAPARRLGWVAVWAVLLGAAALGLWGGDAVARGTAYPRLEGMIPAATLVTGAQLALAVALAVGLYRAATAAKGSFFRIAPVIAYALGWLMIISLWAGIGLRLADWFGTGQADTSRFWHDVAATCSPGRFCYPIWYEDAAVAFAAILLLGLSAAVAVLLWPPALSDVDAVVADFGEPTTDQETRRLRNVARKHRHARLVRVADDGVAAVIVIGILSFVAVGLVQAANGWRFPSPLVTASGWLVALAPLVAVLVVRLALNNPSARRAVGSVFDVLTFFPRRVHPFAPPCYGERAVPQLGWRLGWLTRRGRGVVVRAHSQGTALTAAALLLGTGSSERISLVTYGSPLVMLYERHFPAYFHSIVERIGAALGETPGEEPRWVHVCARTDILGCRLSREESPLVIQVRVLDPESWGPPRPGDPPPKALGHSTYHRHRAVGMWVVYLLGRSAGRPTEPPDMLDDNEDACG